MSNIGTISVTLESRQRQFEQAQLVAQEAIRKTEQILYDSQSKIDNIMNVARSGLTTFIDVASEAVESLDNKIQAGGKAAEDGFQNYVTGALEVSKSLLSGLETFDAFKNASNAAFSLVTSLAPKMGPAIATALGPIGLIAAAVGGLYVVVKENFDGISSILLDTTNWFIRLYNKSTIFRVAVEILRGPFEDLIIIGKGLYEVIKAAFDLDGEGVRNAIKNIGTDLLNAKKLAALRIQGNVEIAELKKEDWDRAVKPIRDFIVGIPSNLSEPPLEQITNTVNKIVETANKEASDKVVEIRAKLDFPSLDKTDGQKAIEIIARMGEKSEDLRKKYSLLNDENGFLREKTQEVRKALEELGSQGLDATNPLVQALINQYGELTKEADKATKAQSKALGGKGDKNFTADIGNALTSSEPENSLAIGNGLAFKTVSDLAKNAKAIALNIEIPNQAETEAALDSLNQKLLENQRIIASADASNAAKAAANANILAINAQTKAEKDKASILKQVTREVLGTIKERIKGYLAEGIAGMLGKEAGKGIIGLAVGAAGAGILVGLFDKLVPKLAIGTDYVNRDGLAYLHKGEAVVDAASVKSGGFSGGNSNNVKVEVVGHVSGLGIKFANDIANEKYSLLQ